MAKKSKPDARELKQSSSGKRIAAPKLNYQPPTPRRYQPRIGLIGCGGISPLHLRAYRKAGWNVVAMCDLKEDKMRERQQKFYPKAELYGDYHRLLERDDIDVIDATPHPIDRFPIVKDSLLAGKHVLSQKPFVLDLDKGEELAALADKQKRRLAVNQNGRWAPYFSYLRQAIKAGLLGEIRSVDLSSAWDHSWIKGTKFETIHHIILYDFAIHWFDICASIYGNRPVKHVFANVTRVAGQTLQPPMSAQVMAAYENGLASLTFHAHTKLGPMEEVVVTGTKGTFRSSGGVCHNNRITLFTEKGYAKPRLKGNWMPDGWRGTMGELLCSIEENREPDNSARNNLRSLELCFAAIKSADSGQPEVPGKVRKVGKSCQTH